MLKKSHFKLSLIFLSLSVQQNIFSSDKDPMRAIAHAISQTVGNTTNSIVGIKPGMSLEERASVVRGFIAQTTRTVAEGWARSQAMQSLTGEVLAKTVAAKVLGGVLMPAGKDLADGTLRTYIRQEADAEMVRRGMPQVANAFAQGSSQPFSFAAQQFGSSCQSSSAAASSSVPSTFTFNSKWFGPLGEKK